MHMQTHCSDSSESATYAMIDSGGANCTGIVPELVRRLDMEVKLKMKTVTVLDRKTTAERELVSFEIASLDEEVCIKVKDALVSEILTTASDKPHTNGKVEGLDYMEGIVSFQELDDWRHTSGPVCLNMARRRNCTGRSGSNYGIED
jgi:hypothetical protein